MISSTEPLLMDTISTPSLEHIDPAVRSTTASRRPLLHHLNADTSWLLQIPIPASAPQTPRQYYNILLDPWLSGSQTDLASWFSTQWHASPPAYPTIADVAALALRAEPTAPTATTNPVDLVLLSHEFTDHTHKATLLTFPPSTPIFAAAPAAKLVRSWAHFSTVHAVPAFPAPPSPWRAASAPPLPPWLAVARLTTPGDRVGLHAALLVAFAADAGADSPADAVVYTPHGIAPAALQCVADAAPRIRTLALLHGRHDVRLAWGQQLNLGAGNGAAAAGVVGARKWVGTHDEVKKAEGLVRWMLRRKVGEVQEGKGWVEVRNGGCVVLGEDG